MLNEMQVVIPNQNHCYASALVILVPSFENGISHNSRCLLHSNELHIMHFRLVVS